MAIPWVCWADFAVEHPAQRTCPAARAHFDVFNVSAVDSIGRVETLKRLTAVYGRLPEVRDPALYARDPYASVLDARRARDRLGWEPEGDWASIVARHQGDVTTP